MNLNKAFAIRLSNLLAEKIWANTDLKKNQDFHILL